MLANAKKIPKEKGLQAVICCCIWEPDEAIEKARRKEIYDSDIRGVADSEDYKLLYGIEEQTFVTLTYHQFFADLVLIYLNPNEVMRPAAIFHEKKLKNFVTLT